MATASEVMAPLAALAGENEAVVGSNNTTVNKYFGVRGASYCGYSLLYSFAKAGSALLNGSGAANVGDLARFCEAKGWRVSSPRAGDIFVMRAGGYENGHTGFVWEVLDSGRFITLEGNYGSVKATAAQAKNGTGATYEGIGYRLAQVSGDYKFYRPAYDGADSSGETTPAPAVDKKAMVKQWQTWLGVDPDGDPGPDTEQAALKKMLLAMLAKRPLRKGTSGDDVKVLQGLLYARGYDPGGLDGDYGSGTAAEVRAFQEIHDLDSDGVTGKDTLAELLDVVFG